ncbi:MAG: hypothetical protein U5Q16_05275 [Gammaproteobacteria bacterium]|nr:hypothetical protein [Gammaproteobacteria bacterium]
MTETTDHAARFSHDHYTIRTQFFRLFGGAFHIFAGDGELVLYSDQKRFRLKEDIRLYDDEAKSTELLRISTQSVFDFSGAYDVHDSATGERVGTLKREGLSSTFLRDQWQVFDAAGQEVGRIMEDSTVKALARRFVDLVSVILPQRYHAEIQGRTAAIYRQRFNPVIFKLDLDLSGDPGETFDRRLAVAAGVLFSAVEGRQ